jgi:alpha-glucosidase
MADFGEGLPFDAVLASGEDPAVVHNRYPEDWAALNREVLAQASNGDDGVFFTRSGFTNSPGNSTLFWLGDQLVSWDEHDGMKTAVTGLLSSGLSGFSLNHSDIGGYTTILSPLGNFTRSQELLLRWMELNAFTTVFRSHEGNRPADNVQVYSNPETLAHFSRMAQVYAAWLPYRRQLVQEAADTGLPVVRHPFIHYPDDPQVLDLSYQQFMVGSEFMVAPVLDPGVTEVDVYLPAGRWVHVWSGQVFGDPAQGQRVQVDAPLGQPAVFFKEGSPAGQQFIEALDAAGLRAQPVAS